MASHGRSITTEIISAIYHHPFLTPLPTGIHLGSCAQNRLLHHFLDFSDTLSYFRTEDSTPEDHLLQLDEYQERHFELDYPSRRIYISCPQPVPNSAIGQSTKGQSSLKSKATMCWVSKVDSYCHMCGKIISESFTREKCVAVDRADQAWGSCGITSVILAGANRHDEYCQECFIRTYD